MKLLEAKQTDINNKKKKKFYPFFNHYLDTMQKALRDKIKQDLYSWTACKEMLHCKINSSSLIHSFAKFCERKVGSV